MNTHEVLVAARNLISDEKDWRGGGSHPAPSGMCAAVAISRAHEGFEMRHFDALGDALGLERWRPCASVDVRDIFRWNDTHSHAEVLAAFDEAIAATAPMPDTAFLSEVEEPVAA